MGKGMGKGTGKVVGKVVGKVAGAVKFADKIAGERKGGRHAPPRALSSPPSRTEPTERTARPPTRWRSSRSSSRDCRGRTTCSKDEYGSFAYKRSVS